MTNASEKTEELSKEELRKQINLAAKLEGFELIDLIGTGGFGSVYKAKDKRLERTVALKFFSKRAETQEFNLKKEAESASRLSHENIAQVYSWHDSNDLVFYSMEYIQGVSLDEYLRMYTNVDVYDKLRIIAEAARGLSAAHSQGILHRDIKPQNILVSKEGQVKIVDFGLSRKVQEVNARSRSKMIAGTLGYMSPEQASGKATNEASDIYSLTATAYYILTDQHPFAKHTTDTKELLKANQSGKFTPLLEITQDLPPSVYKWMTKGLSSSPERRFQSAEEFYQEVQGSMFTMESPNKSGKSSSGSGKSIAIFLSGLIIGIIIGFILRSVA